MIFIEKWDNGEKLNIRASISIKDSGYVWGRGMVIGMEIKSFAIIYFALLQYSIDS